MPEITIPPGVVRGATPAQSTGRWANANQIIWRDGIMQPLPGWTRVTDQPISSTPRRLMIALDLLRNPHWYVGCDDKLIAYSGGAIRDITPDGFSGQGQDGSIVPDGFGVGEWGRDGDGPDDGEHGFGTPRAEGNIDLLRSMTWSLSSFNGRVIASASTDGRLLTWDPATTDPNAKATVLSPAAPTGVTASIVAAKTRQVMTAGVTGNPNRVAFSGYDDPQNWTITGSKAVNGTAGWIDLECDGSILGLYEVAGGILAISDSDVWLLEWIGAPGIWRRTRISRATSILSPHTVAVWDGKAAWMTRQGFAIYANGSVQTLPCDVAYSVFRDMHPLYGPLTSHGAAVGEREIMWCYPDETSVSPNRYVIYSHVEGWWSVGELDRTAMLNAGAHLYPVGASSSGHLYQHNDGTTDAGASRIGQIWAETGILVGEGQYRVQGAQLDSGAGIAASRMQVISRTVRDGPDRISPVYSPNAAGITKSRFGGRDVRVRIEAATDGDWSVGKPIIDIVQMGNK